MHTSYNRTVMLCFINDMLYISIKANIVSDIKMNILVQNLHLA